MRLNVVMAVAVLAVLATDAGGTALTRRAETVEDKAHAADSGAAIAQLEARVKELEGRVPDSAMVMTHVAYHFTNLWFAGRQRNWSLADYYLGEARKDVTWAARLHPVRQGPGGDVDVVGIAEAVDNTQFSTLAQAIQKKNSGAFVRAYDESLAACAACHQAIGKPYLRPQRPTSPDEHILGIRGHHP